MAAVLLPSGSPRLSLQFAPVQPLLHVSPACLCMHLRFIAELCPPCPPTLTLCPCRCSSQFCSLGFLHDQSPQLPPARLQFHAHARRASNVTSALKETRPRGKWEKSSMWGRSNEGINQSALQTKERTSQGEGLGPGQRRAQVWACLSDFMPWLRSGHGLPRRCRRPTAGARLHLHQPALTPAGAASCPASAAAAHPSSRRRRAPRRCRRR